MLVDRFCMDEERQRAQKDATQHKLKYYQTDVTTTTTTTKQKKGRVISSYALNIPKQHYV